MIELTQDFVFDAAHVLSQGDADNRGVHGHSFYVEVTLRGEPDPSRGWLRDFSDVRRAIESIRVELDHKMLNELDGLEVPTLENLARFIFQRAKARLPETSKVRIRRPSLGQSCSYQPGDHAR